MNDLVFHAFTCYGECSNKLLALSCNTIKQSVQHFRDCNSKECDICRQMNQLVEEHAQHCTLDNCPVTNCKAIRGVTALQQMLMQSSSNSSKPPTAACPKTPEKNKEYSCFGSAIKSPLKCMKCQLPLTEQHSCTPNRSLQASPGTLPSSPGQGKFLLSPLRKRRFDTWSETNSEEVSPSQTQANSADSEEGSPALQLFTEGDDDQEIIHLPVNPRSPNKVPKLDIKKTLKRPANKGLPRWSTFSFPKAVNSNTTSPQKPATIKTGNKQPSSEPHFRSNSWSGFPNGFLCQALEKMQKHQKQQLSKKKSEEKLKEREAAKRVSLFPDPPMVIQDQTSDSMISNPAFAGFTLSVDVTGSGSTSEMITEQDILYSLLSPKVQDSSRTIEMECIQQSVVIEGASSVDSDDDLKDLDLSAITLDVTHENTEEWQKLMIYTPTSRNRPETRRNKPVIVKETVFEDHDQQEANISLPSSTTTKTEPQQLLFQKVAFDLPSIPYSNDQQALFHEMAQFTEELKVSSSNDPMLLQLLSLEKSEESEEEEIFRYLNQNHRHFLQPETSNAIANSLFIE